MLSRSLCSVDLVVQALRSEVRVWNSHLAIDDVLPSEHRPGEARSHAGERQRDVDVDLLLRVAGAEQVGASRPADPAGRVQEHEAWNHGTASSHARLHHDTGQAVELAAVALAIGDLL